MISNIPTSGDFYDSGQSHLNFAWDTVITLCLELDESVFYGAEIDEVQAPFWQAARRHLATSLAIAQQGVEFILKGRIAEISPFLLISNTPKEFPKPISAGVNNFQDFRTIDAQDLIKVYNTFSATPLSSGFTSKFEEMRTKRNVIMHTVDKTLQLVAADILADIISIHNCLFPKEKYLDVRRSYLDVSPLSQLHSADHVESHIIRECQVLLDIFKPKQMKEYFNFDKRQRRYICPICYIEVNSADSDIIPMSAILSPNTSTSKTVRCFVCEVKSPIERAKCLSRDCKGNVITADDKQCLTCGHYDETK